MSTSRSQSSLSFDLLHIEAFLKSLRASVTKRDDSTLDKTVIDHDAHPSSESDITSVSRIIRVRSSRFVVAPQECFLDTK